jgi:hypothetical protein
VSYLIGIALVVVFFLFLHLFSEVTKLQKIAFSATLLVVILGAIAYNQETTKQRDLMMQTIIKFNQNKTVVCDGIDINNTNFSLSIGTYTFIGLKDKPNYGQMISASTCH